MIGAEIADLVAFEFSSDDGTELKLITAEGDLIAIVKSEIDEQVCGKSAMPEDLIKKLSKAEVRDLLEFLAGLK